VGKFHIFKEQILIVVVLAQACPEFERTAARNKCQVGEERGEMSSVCFVNATQAALFDGRGAVSDEGLRCD
jgi:hypothetical protein